MVPPQDYQRLHNEFYDFLVDVRDVSGLATTNQVFLLRRSPLAARRRTSDFGGRERQLAVIVHAEPHFALGDVNRASSSPKTSLSSTTGSPTA
jgi:hypothetical protein